jgi:hypothetical protein
MRHLLPPAVSTVGRSGCLRSPGRPVGMTGVPLVGSGGGACGITMCGLGRPTLYLLYMRRFQNMKRFFWWPAALLIAAGASLGQQPAPPGQGAPAAGRSSGGGRGPGGGAPQGEPSAQGEPGCHHQLSPRCPRLLCPSAFNASRPPAFSSSGSSPAVRKPGRNCANRYFWWCVSVCAWTASKLPLCAPH